MVREIGRLHAGGVTPSDVHRRTHSEGTVTGREQGARKQYNNQARL
jgi:hypothetical protein